MQNKNFTFDYLSGTVRRDLLAEGQKAIYVKTAPKVANKGIISSVKSLFARK